VTRNCWPGTVWLTCTLHATTVVPAPAMIWRHPFPTLIQTFHLWRLECPSMSDLRASEDVDAFFIGEREGGEGRKIQGVRG
jgi:hypothetical protein